MVQQHPGKDWIHDRWQAAAYGRARRCRGWCRWRRFLFSDRVDFVDEHDRSLVVRLPRGGACAVEEASDILRAFRGGASSPSETEVKDVTTAAESWAAVLAASRDWRWEARISRRLFLAAEASGIEVEGITTTAAIIHRGKKRRDKLPEFSQI